MTRRPPTLSVLQRDYLVRVAERLKPEQRSVFWDTIGRRLSGTPTNAALVRVATTVRAEIERPGEILARA
jgi:hypothetical protein